MAIRNAGVGEVVDLRPLGAELKHARTTAITKSELFEAVRLVVPAGTEIKPHTVDDPITLHCLEGRVLLGLPASTIELCAGQWLYLEGGEPHSVKAIEDTSLLLTIIFASESRGLNPEGLAKARRKAAVRPAAQSSESLLDEGLEGTFPASDPVSISNPSTGIRITPSRDFDKDER